MKARTMPIRIPIGPAASTVGRVVARTKTFKTGHVSLMRRNRNNAPTVLTPVAASTLRQDVAVSVAKLKTANPEYLDALPVANGSTKSASLDTNPTPTRAMSKWVTVAMGVWCVVLIWLAFTDYGNSQRYQEWIDQGITVIPPSPDLAQQIEPAGSYAQREGGEEFKCAYLSGGLSTSECPDGVSDPIKVSNFVDERGLVCWNYDDYTPGTTLEIPDDEAVTTGLDTEPSETVRICTAVWTSYGLLRFAEQAGLDCPDVDAVVASISTGASEYPGCERALSYAEDFQASQDRSRLIWLLVIVSVIIVAFPYLSLIHRASRNLLPLQSEQQKHAPEWAVLHHFIPIMNLFRPGQVMKEMFKGSDPNVNTDDATAWKKQGKLRAILGLWWILWVASWIFNPITVPRFVNAQSLPELIEANDLLLLSDVLLIFLGVSAVLMLRQLHAIQEMKFEKIGLITVTPPPPVDPLAEALKKQEEQQRAKEERKNRRGR